MNQQLRADANAVIHEAIRAVLPDAAASWRIWTQ